MRMASQTRQRNLARVVALSTLVASGMLGFSVREVAAETPSSDWVATARASASDIDVLTTGGFIVDRIDPSGALAVSRVETTIEQAASLASAPYPSEIGQQGPGLVYGLLQNTLPYNGVPVPDLGVAPAYPLIIRSSANGSEPPSASSGGEGSPVELKAESQPRSASAMAAIGGVVPGTLSVGRQQAASATTGGETSAVAKASSSIENVVIGDVVKIAEIRTDVDVTRRAGAKPEVVVHRQIKGASIAGVAADIRSDGLFVKDTNVPLPQPALDALKTAGIDLRFGETNDIDGGVSASGLTVHMPFDLTQLSGDQGLPLALPKTVTLVLSLAMTTGVVTEVGSDLTGGFETVGSDSAAPAESSDPAPAHGNTSAPTTSLAATPGWLPEAVPSLRPDGTNDLLVAAEPPEWNTLEDVNASEEANSPLTEPEGAAAPPGADATLVRSGPVLSAADATVVAGSEHKKEMGRLGWLAQVAAIAFVLLLVVGRARRVVGGA